MREIKVDDSVYIALEGRASGFSKTPNDVLRSLLGIDRTESRPQSAAATLDALATYVESPDYKALRGAEDRYLAVLGRLYALHQVHFQKLAAYGRGTRPYFADSEKKIKTAADYAGAKRIPDTPYFAMTTLDNKSKRKVLAYALELCGYSPSTVAKVIATLPTRPRNAKPEH